MARGPRLFCAALVGMLAACSTFTAANDSSGGGAGDGGKSGGPPPAAEDCLDGADDNGDGKRDCEEPSCAPYARCVPDPGALDGWSGYFTLVFGGDCPSTIPASNGDVWTAAVEQASCAECKCEASISCTGSLSIAEAIDGACMTTKPFSLVIGQCGTIPTQSGGPAQYWSFAASGSPKCTPSSAPPTLSAKFTRARLCSSARLGAGCPPGEVCGPASTASGSGGPSLCVAHPHPGGAPLPCPSAFPVAHLMVGADSDPNSAFDDRRACEACSCAGPMGASCNAVLTLASDGACGTIKGQAPQSMCTNVSCAGACGSGRVDVNPTAGACTPKGGAPLGGVELVGAGQQLCCDR